MAMTKNIQVTELNQYSVPKDMLLKRLDRIKRMWTKQEKPELMDEANLIINRLRDLNVDITTSADQMEFDIPRTLREQYVGIVEMKLRTYRNQLRRKKRIKEELPEQPYSIITSEIPRSTASYGNLSGVSARGGIHSSTEDAIFRPFDREERLRKELASLELEMEDMEIALAKLYEHEWQVIESLYLKYPEPSNDQLIYEFNWGRQKYYDAKRSALQTIASSFGII
ncbi:hypothetical protein [Paenibacillus polymyxa]|uniref:hypothetical protein n=1 Tax=Paenibacillus polymyxa TaxID=1406 RepID=UPI0025B6ABE8|nr:hypothetical protein [Paenibacillus polymyxa]